MNFGRECPITTLTPVTIGIILNGSQLDTGSLIQAERDEKALKRIQKKMMHARSTLDWSQSNNISCLIFTVYCVNTVRYAHSKSLWTDFCVLTIFLRYICLGQLKSKTQWNDMFCITVAVTACSFFL